MTGSSLPDKIGLIAGNGDFPIVILQACRKYGIRSVVAAAKDEASEVLDQYADRIVWMGVGQMGRMIRYFKKEGVAHAVMAGQIRHVRIFGKDHPDLRMLFLLTRLKQRNSDAILLAVADEMAREGITLIDSTLLLQDLVPKVGVLTRRAPNEEERKDIAFGRRIAKEIARLDIGQTVVVRGQAVLAVEAMEGTDAAIERASGCCFGKKTVVVKVSKPKQDLRFDVPVMGPRTVEALKKCNVSTMAIDAGKSIILHRERVLQAADEAGIAIVAFDPDDLG